MEIFKNPKFDWLGMKWYFLAFSVLLATAAASSLIFKGGLKFSVDFTGGTLIYVKFNSTPDLERVRSVFSAGEFRLQSITGFDEASLNQIQIRMGDLGSDADSTDGGDGGDDKIGTEGSKAYEALRAEFDPEHVPATGEGAAAAKQDLNRIGRNRLSTWLSSLSPSSLGVTGEGGATAGDLVEKATDAIVSYRTAAGGLINDFSELDSVELSDDIRLALRENFYLGSFTLISEESVGPKVGSELRERAQLAVTLSLLGMLVYITFRFQFIYGVAAIVALFHDVIITIGAFSLTDREISLTVIAALMTLVGYSLNDTIVVFDRVRENLRAMRRKDMLTIINLSINQTLNRTILTSATFFMAALALFMLGGDALGGFSFALVIGVLVGTYSSVAVASPIVLWWDRMSSRKKGS